MKQFKTLPTGLIIYQQPRKNVIRVEIVTPQQIKTANKWYVKLINRISI